MKDKEVKSVYFTDKELYYIALAFKSHLNSRDTWISSQGARVINNVINKVKKIGMKRRNPKSILHPIINFENNTNQN